MKHGVCDEVKLLGMQSNPYPYLAKSDLYVCTSSSETFSYTIHEFVSLIPTNGTAKRVRLSEFEPSTRTRRGIQIIREVKSKPYIVQKALVADSRSYIGVKNGDIAILKNTELPIADRYSTGSQVSKKQISDAFIVAQLVKPNMDQMVLEESSEEQEKPKKERMSLEEIDDRLMTIDDFLK